MDQTQLASSAACSASYISLLEDGKRQATLSTLETLAKAFDVPLFLLTLLATESGDVGAADAQQLAPSLLKALTR
jgi:transcriptional regulator with XRE-family HTH domain